MKNGYPTKKELKFIRDWNTLEKGVIPLIEYIYERWMYQGYFSVIKIDEITKLHLSTVGWSGNEDIIEALKKNVFFWPMFWVCSRRGGHYEFEIREVKE